MTSLAAGAMGARTARACDSCLRRRARWYCAADDAFLCQGCDNSVHSANQLAGRHDRVRLKTASTSPAPAAPVPSWQKAVKRKARTPRHKVGRSGKPTCLLVPDLEEAAAEEAEEEEEAPEDLIYRVPVFDRVLAELIYDDGFFGGEKKPVVVEKTSSTPTEHDDGDGVCRYLQSDMDMTEFALDVESLLGQGLDQGPSFCMDDLGFSGSQDCSGPGNSCVSKVKEEEEEEKQTFVGAEMDTSDETFDIKLGCGSPSTTEGSQSTVDRKRKTVMLTLDYESVINTWSSSSTHASPWADGFRPTEFDLHDCWLDYTRETEMMVWGGGGEMGMAGAVHAAMGMASTTIDIGREARVSRYREKRRTRLYSKKIRYEVRKLNAEKRPRMKGRFVKRP